MRGIKWKVPQILKGPSCRGSPRLADVPRRWKMGGGGVDGVPSGTSSAAAVWRLNGRQSLYCCGAQLEA